MTNPNPNPNPKGIPMNTITFLVTVADPGNITSDPANIRTILTSTDNIQPRERVTVTAIPEALIQAVAS